jgi:tyrosinase
MRCSILLFAATVVSGVALPKLAPLVDDKDFKTFKPFTLDDIKAGKDLIGMEHNKTHVGIASNLATAQTASAASCAANPNMRYEWRQYSTSDRLAFVSAIKCLIGKPPSGKFSPATNRYEDLVRLHQNYMPNIHNNAKFLIWHRYYLWTFEQVLRSECGFNRAFPWWDETKDAGRFGQSDMFTNNAYFGNLPNQAVCVNSGAFAGMTCHIGPGNSNTAHCLSRKVDESLTSQCNSDFVNYCNSRTSYADMESCTEGGPHAYGHNGIGSVMSDVSASPSDPIFWMHHTFVDHSFRIWQNADGNRVNTVNGVNAQGQPLTMDTIVSVGGIRPDVRVRDIMNTMGGTVIGGVPFCYRYNY